MAPAAESRGGKSEDAFRTISELAAEIGVPQHILRYWETRFPQLRPLQRAGNRRYYRPADVALARRIYTLLERDGYTIKGVQRLLAGGTAEPDSAPVAPAPANQQAAPDQAGQQEPVQSAGALARIRALLADALEADAR